MLTMDPTELKEKLERACSDRDPMAAFTDVAKALDASGGDLTSVGIILKFMESHPETELGLPGPLVHFAERFHGSGYEAELLASLRRRPTSHTVWMLHRMINGTTDERTRDNYWAALREAAVHHQADGEARRACAQFVRERGGG